MVELIILFFVIFTVLLIIPSVFADEIDDNFDKGYELQDQAFDSKNQAFYDDAISQHESAITFFDMVLDEDPTNINALEAKGISLHEIADLTGDVKFYEESILVYDIILEIEPNYPSALAGKGNSLVYAGYIYGDDHPYTQQGLELQKQAFQIDPNDPYILNEYANNLAELGKYGKAIALYDKMLEIDPNDISALNNKGVALIDQGHYEEAIPYFEKALELDPLDFLPLQNLGLALSYLERYSEAVPIFKDVLKRDPGNIDALVNIGIAYLANGMYEKSITSFDKVLDDEPDNFDALKNKATALSYIGDYDDALEIFDDILFESPNDSELLENKAWTHYQLNQFDESLNLLEELLKTDPTNSKALLAKSTILAETGNTEDAKTILSQASENTSNNVSEKEITAVNNLIETVEQGGDVQVAKCKVNNDLNLLDFTPIGQIIKIISPPPKQVDCSKAYAESTQESTQSSGGEGGGCLIATAAYGTELAPQVQFLREIRDNTVMSTVSGTSFMTGFNQLYYSFSPPIADMERENPMFQEAVRIFITPMISTLPIMTLADNGSEIEVLGLGISVIALNLGMYIIAPVLIGFQVRKIIKSRNY